LQSIVNQGIFIMIFPYVLGFYNLKGGLRYATEWVNFSLIKNKDVQVKLEFFKKQKKKNLRIKLLTWISLIRLVKLIIWFKKINSK
jgi:hypothetical protein